MEIRSSTLRKMMHKEHKQQRRTHMANEHDDRVTSRITLHTIMIYLIDNGPSTSMEISQRLMGGGVCLNTRMRTDALLQKLINDGYVSYGNLVYSANKG